jgi:aspartyl-tRNA(Asn)/glutamyl-tRNA(Gln) amidotransferase subunit B
VYASAVGLEVHVQLATRTKVFCGCPAAFGDEPNSNVCPVCLGYPGALPALNGQAVRLGYLVARALGCALAKRILFERKNYFYPDLPKNYQISQYRAPIGTDGSVEIELRGRRRRVRIREVHLEEDAGKMIHAGEATLLDFNRAGTPLLEIVSDPDMEVGEEAEVFLQQLRRLVRWLAVSDGNMEEGSLRCDANVSVNPAGEGLGSKVEVKNLNSFKFVRRAITFEIGRQQEILDRGGTVLQETRLWNENRDCTEAMRVKESAHDYRYFPEPDLPPFTADPAFLAEVEAALVELPEARRRRFAEQYQLSEAQAAFVCEERELADFFEQTVRHGAEGQAVATWLAADVRKVLNRLGRPLAETPLTPKRLAELLALLAARRIHGRIAKAVLDAVFEEGKDPSAIIRERGWEQITDRAALLPHVDAALGAHPKVVEAVRGGDARPAAYLVGEVMRATSGRAEPGLVQELVRERLEVKTVQVLSLGGAIVGRRTEGGEVAPGDPAELGHLLAADGTAGRIAFEELELGRILSEEIAPEHWAALIVALDEHLRQQRESGIVIAHGTDTLAYTASLVFWLYSRPPVPIVLAASLAPLGAPASDAAPTLRRAIEVASRGEPGVSVVFGGKVFSPLNLRFERVAADGFRNWNLASPVHTAAPLIPDLALGEPAKVRERLEGAINRTALLRVYPGMRGDLLVAAMNQGVRAFVLELYDTGTASLRESPYSLRRAFLEARERGARFFCTSQQEGIVDFSRYVTSHELWREGAVPMGSLTTESAYTRLVACLAFSDSEEEAFERMERFDANAGR